MKILKNRQNPLFNQRVTAQWRAQNPENTEQCNLGKTGVKNLPPDPFRGGICNTWISRLSGPG